MEVLLEIFKIVAIPAAFVGVLILRVFIGRDKNRNGE